MHAKFWSKNLKGKDHPEDLDVDEKDNIGMEVGREGVDWMNLAQDGHQWRAIVNMVMNLRFT
jgi:hypothetical protein